MRNLFFHRLNQIICLKNKTITLILTQLTRIWMINHQIINKRPISNCFKMIKCRLVKNRKFMIQVLISIIVNKMILLQNLHLIWFQIYKTKNQQNQLSKTIHLIKIVLLNLLHPFFKQKTQPKYQIIVFPSQMKILAMINLIRPQKKIRKKNQ